MNTPSPTVTVMGGISKAIWGTLTGLASAALYAFVQKNLGEDVSFLAAYAGLMTIVFIGVPLYMVAFAKGAIACVIAAVTGTVGLFALGLSESIPYYVLSSALPASVFGAAALLSRRDDEGKLYWFPEGYLVTGLSFYAALVFLGTALWFRKEEGGLYGKTLVLLQDSWTMLKEKTPDEAMAMVAGADMTKVMESVARHMPSGVGLLWISVAIMSALVSLSVVKRQRWAIRDSLTLKDFTVPSWLLIGVAGTGLLGAMGEGTSAYMGMNLCVFLCVPFFFNGLSLIHAAAARHVRRGGSFLLVLTYLLLSLLPWLVILICLLGTIENGLGLRKRMEKPEN